MIFKLSGTEHTIIINSPTLTRHSVLLYHTLPMLVWSGENVWHNVMWPGNTGNEYYEMTIPYLISFEYLMPDTFKFLQNRNEFLIKYDIPILIPVILFTWNVWVKKIKGPPFQNSTVGNCGDK